MDNRPASWPPDRQPNTYHYITTHIFCARQWKFWRKSVNDDLPDHGKSLPVRESQQKWRSQQRHWWSSQWHQDRLCYLWSEALSTDACVLTQDPFDQTEVCNFVEKEEKLNLESKLLNGSIWTYTNVVTYKQEPQEKYDMHVQDEKKHEGPTIKILEIERGFITTLFTSGQNCSKLSFLCCWNWSHTTHLKMIITPSNQTQQLFRIVLVTDKTGPCK